jgi:hypothetical protein
VNSRAGLDDAEKRKFLILPGLELRSLDRPTRSQLLYRLRYPGSNLERVNGKIFRKFLWANLDGGPYEEQKRDGTECLPHGLHIGFVQWSLKPRQNVGRAIAQAVSRRLPTAAARVQTRVWSCGIL